MEKEQNKIWLLEEPVMPTLENQFYWIDGEPPRNYLTNKVHPANAGA